METPPEYPAPPQETTARIDNSKDIKLTIQALEKAAADGKVGARDLADRTVASLEDTNEIPALTFDLDETIVVIGALRRHRERFRPFSTQRRAELVENVAKMALEDIKTSAQTLKESELLRPQLESIE